MQIKVKASNLNLTPAIEEYIDTKIGSLAKFFEPWEKTRDVVIRVEIARKTMHHRKGEVYYAEANIDSPLGLLRTVEDDFDIRVAIDKVKDALQRQIKKQNSKLRPQDSSGQKNLRKLRGKK